MKTANLIIRLISAAILCLPCAAAYAQEKPYTEGSIWAISMIRVKPGMLDVYMREVLPLRKKINERLVAEPDEKLGALPGAEVGAEFDDDIPF